MIKIKHINNIKNKNEYNSSSFTFLKDLEGIWVRPEMYIGNVDEYGILHLFKEVFANAIDELTARPFIQDNVNKNQIFIHFFSDKSIQITDVGWGFPIKNFKELKENTLEASMCRLHFGAKFKTKKNYQFAGGLHGVGLCAVNALSSFTNVFTIWNQTIYNQTFSFGKKKTNLKSIGLSELKHIKPFFLQHFKWFKTGTLIHFKPDKSIFKYIDESNIKVKTLIIEYIRYISFLNPTLKIKLFDLNNPMKLFENKGGLKDFLRYLQRGRVNEQKLTLDEFYFKHRIEHWNHIFIIEFCFNFNLKESWSEYHSFVNNISTKDGGSHETSFKNALLKYVQSYAKEESLFENDNFNHQDIKKGIVCIISVYMNDPRFSGQTKSKLSSKQIIKPMHEAVHTFMQDLKFMHKEWFNNLLNLFIKNKEWRCIDHIKKDLSQNFTSILPYNLIDCSTTDFNRWELFIVEGRSAGATAKLAWDKVFQAIYSLKGKILNVEKETSINKIINNTEIQNLLKVLCKFKKGKVASLRYKHVFLMMDADEDGKHIWLLVITLIWKLIKEIIENDSLFMAMPPLFSIKQNGKNIFFMNQVSLDKYIQLNWLKNIHVQWYKGLGEMNHDQLHYTMHPDYRHIIRVNFNNFDQADQIIKIFMGKSIEERKDFFFTNII